MPSLKKGETGPLNVTKEARHRVFVGLGWDPNEDTGLIDKAKAMVKGQELNHDLDLSAYVFDAKNRMISHICADSGRHTDQTGKIYHSGDNTEGLGDGDDEQISVELKNLDPLIHQIVFTASIKTGQTFGDINNPEIRIADGYSEHTFLHHNLKTEGGGNAHAYIFVRIFRDSNAWALTHIDEYLQDNDREDWLTQIRKHLQS